MTRRLAIAAFAAIVLAGVDWQYLLLPFLDRSALAERARRTADREWYPLYPRFLAEVRARTKDGSSIAIVAPPQRWMDGYDFAFYRASYLLAGRTVLPVLDSKDALHPENLRAADYVAVWGRPFQADERSVIVWRGEGGALLGRR
ncbi:MAG TPA: hypothetical protein VN605_06650 [Thermoanaerobaculia bacterium]|nr:hypothetical protein [Thermoanaerobaculia bacterium]